MGNKLLCGISGIVYEKAMVFAEAESKPIHKIPCKADQNEVWCNFRLALIENIAVFWRATKVFLFSDELNEIDVHLQSEMNL